MTDNNNNKNCQLDDFFDESPTDELPIPVFSDSAPEDDGTAHSLAIDTECPTGTDIRVLEPDAAVTGTDTEHGDAAISRLEAAYEELECELQAIAAERASAESAVAELRLELKQRDVDLAEVSTCAGDAAQELVESRAELNKLQLRLGRVQTEVDEREKAAEGVEQRTETLEKLNAEHRAEVATLAGYIDGRKAEWKSLHDELRKHRDTIAALEHSLGTAASSLARKEKEKEALDVKTADLQHRLTLLGQYCRDSDREIATFKTRLASLQADMQKKDQTIDRLECNLRNQLAALQAVRGKVDRLDTQSTHQIVAENQQADRSVTCLMVATNGDRVMKYPLYKKVITIGRSHLSDIQIRTEYVSREHARILTDDLGTFIEDLGSRNGIRVNAIQVEKRRLKHGDCVDIGEVHFKFVDLMDRGSGEANA